MNGDSFFRYPPAWTRPLSLEAAHLRSACSECGSKDLAWMGITELVDAVPAGAKADAREGAAFFGPDADAWLCRSCGHFGIVSQPEVGFG